MFTSFFVCVSNFEKIFFILKTSKAIIRCRFEVGETFYNSHFINNTHLTQAYLGANDEYRKPGFNAEMLMPN